MVADVSRIGGGREFGRGAGNDARLRGVRASKRGGEEDRTAGASAARLMCGVRPVDEEEAVTSGPGSENRTRFFGLVGVLPFVDMVSWESLVLSDCGPAVWFDESVWPLLLRLFRRTAMGLSSKTASLSSAARCLAISESFCVEEDANLCWEMF